jgi:hypothetical protein
MAADPQSRYPSADALRLAGMNQAVGCQSQHRQRPVHLRVERQLPAAVGQPRGALDLRLEADAIAEAERGETVRAEDLLKRLRG